MVGIFTDERSAPSQRESKQVSRVSDADIRHLKDTTNISESLNSLPNSYFLLELDRGERKLWAALVLCYFELHGYNLLDDPLISLGYQKPSFLSSQSGAQQVISRPFLVELDWAHHHLCKRRACSRRVA